MDETCDETWLPRESTVTRDVVTEPLLEGPLNPREHVEVLEQS